MRYEQVERETSVDTILTIDALPPPSTCFDQERRTLTPPSSFALCCSCNLPQRAPIR
ncbi:hypothetical protein FIBSPDRAFT_877171, partial [Athelia psychrophila]